MKNLFNATKATEFLDLKHRQEFYRIKDIYKLSGKDYGGRILYAAADLKRVKKLLDAK